MKVNKILRQIAAILAIISTVLHGLMLIPLIWMIPMTKRVWEAHKDETKELSTKFILLSVVFLDVTAGGLLLAEVIIKNKERINRKNIYMFVAAIVATLATVACCAYLIPLIWMIPMTEKIWTLFFEEKSASVKRSVLTLIFLSLVAGVLLIVDMKTTGKEVVSFSNGEVEVKASAGATAVVTAEEHIKAAKVYQESKANEEQHEVALPASPKKNGSGKRVAVYAAIIGGLAVTSLSLFAVSQFEKVKRTEAQSIVTQATSKLKKANKVKASIEAVIPTTDDPERIAQLNKELEIANQHVYYWEQVVSDFEAETFAVGVKFMIACIPAYLFSMGTLVSVGLILKHAEKVKEKEDEAV